MIIMKISVWIAVIVALVVVFVLGNKKGKEQ